MVKAESLGSWRQVAAIVDGVRTPVGTGVVLIVDTAGYSVSVNGRIVQRGTSVNRFDTGTPESDVTITDGVGAGTTLTQIFRVDGDVLTACAAREGDPRPTEFRSTPGSGHTLSIWLRVPAAEAAASSAALPTWSWIVGIFAWTILEGFNSGEDFGFSYWPGVLLGGAFAFLILMGGCVASKLPWRTALALSLSLTVGVVVFRELRSELEPTLGGFGALLVGTSTGCVAGLVIKAVVGRWLRVPAE
jgi:uncharacterized protein (TIGR03067 family)